VILPLLGFLQLGAAIPSVTLEEALQRATQLDPNYVEALGQIDNAEWGRRQAIISFFVPSVSVGLDMTKYSDNFFNIGTGLLQSTAVTGHLDARYEVFSLRKVTDLTRTKAQQESAVAGELKARFQAAFDTERTYYDALAAVDLMRVAVDRVSRAEEQFEVAKARVLSGAAVQTDSLQLLLELTRAQVDQLRQQTDLNVARLELGRRVGENGPVDAVPLDTLPEPDLPLTLPEAIQQALEQGPQYRVARANERAAEAILLGQRGGYIPTINLSASHVRYDDHFFPSATTVSLVTLSFGLTLWNNAQRELQISQARADRDFARAIKEDLVRAAYPDVTRAYEAYTSAQAATKLSQTAVVVAAENFRVQQTRYRAGATTILDLLDAQFNLSEAQAGLVQARYVARLARAGLEAMLGTRLFPRS
jgi:outer membrane protein TolC